MGTGLIYSIPIDIVGIPTTEGRQRLNAMILLVSYPFRGKRHYSFLLASCEYLLVL